MPSINLKHRAAVHHATAASFSLHRMHMESYADAISALLICFEEVSAERYQLRQQVTLLRDCLKKIEARLDYGPSYGSVEWTTLNDVVVALAAAEPKS